MVLGLWWQAAALPADDRFRSWQRVQKPETHVRVSRGGCRLSVRHFRGFGRLCTGHNASGTDRYQHDSDRKREEAKHLVSDSVLKPPSDSVSLETRIATTVEDFGRLHCQVQESRADIGLSTAMRRQSGREGISRPLRIRGKSFHR